MNNEKLVTLKSYRKEINILELTIDVPYYEDIDKRNMYGTYASTLLKFFNNKRENKNDILEIRNYYDNSKITLIINLDAYRQDSYNTEEEDIEHLKRFMIGNFDMKTEDIEEYRYKGNLYDINYLDNDIDVCNDYIVVNEW